MIFIHKYLFAVIWVAYVVYWRVMSKDIKVVGRIEATRSRLLRLVVIVCVALLFLFPKLPVSVLNGRFIPPGQWPFWVGAVATVGGIAFSIWARHHLGRNWSQAVAVMQEHELITHGPYALVRHPIYTGLLLGLAGSAIALGQWRGLLAFGLVFFVLWNKLKLEEKWMRETFGDSYEAYAKRTAALVPFLI